MFHPSFLVEHIGRFRCLRCGRSPRSHLSVYGQAILPTRGKQVIVRIEFYCTHCQTITSSSNMLSNSEVAALLVNAIRDGRFASRFRDPICVPIPRAPSPSIAKGTPTEPIEEEDVARASRILKRTSFKRSSKSWKQFMERMERGR